MRHKILKKKLGRKKAHLKSMLINLSVALLHRERIKTTLAKAKCLRSFIEPLIHRAKKENLHNRRLLISRLKNEYIVEKLFKKIAPIYMNRNGGYTRIYKLSSFRYGDAAKLALMELVDHHLLIDENANVTKKEDSKKVTST